MCDKVKGPLFSASLFPNCMMKGRLDQPKSLTENNRGQGLESRGLVCSEMQAGAQCWHLWMKCPGFWKTQTTCCAVALEKASLQSHHWEAATAQPGWGSERHRGEAHSVSLWPSACIPESLDNCAPVVPFGS